MEYKFSDKVKGLQASAIREILKFTVDPEVISFAAGNPAPEAFPKKEIADISDELLRTDPILALQYSVTEGYTPLRNFLMSLSLPPAVSRQTNSHARSFSMKGTLSSASHRAL